MLRSAHSAMPTSGGHEGEGQATSCVISAGGVAGKTAGSRGIIGERSICSAMGPNRNVFIRVEILNSILSRFR